MNDCDVIDFPKTTTANLHIFYIQVLWDAHLVLFSQGANVVLERIGHISVFHPDIRNTLQSIPGFWTFSNSCINELIKIVPVAEDDMPSHVEEESLGRDICAGQTSCFRLLDRQGAKTAQNACQFFRARSKPRPDHLINKEPVFLPVLMHSGSCSKARWARAND
jgi:hypothetical protein